MTVMFVFANQTLNPSPVFLSWPREEALEVPNGVFSQWRAEYGPSMINIM